MLALLNIKIESHLTTKTKQQQKKRCYTNKKEKKERKKIFNKNSREPSVN